MLIDFCGSNHICTPEFHICRPDGFDYWLFIMFKSQAIVTIHGTDHVVSPGNVILYQKGTPQDYRPLPGVKFVHDFFQFSCETLQEEILLEGLPYGQIIKAQNPNQLAQGFSHLSDEYYSANAYRDEAMSHLGNILLLRLREQFVSVTTHSFNYRPEFTRIRSEIYREPQKKRTIASLAEEANLSASHFQALYTKIFGVSCWKDIITARLNLAKRTLESTDLQITQVATACGYDSNEHFMRQFKTYIGQTPKEYRIRHRSSVDSGNPADRL